MPFYRVNMMGGFRVPDKEQVLSEGEVYEFSEEEVAESRGLSAALRGRWMIETNKDGKPVSKAGPKQVSAAKARPPAVEADMYPDSELDGDGDEMARVNAEETALHFDDAAAAEDVVATPAGVVGPRKAKKPASKKPASKKPASKKPASKKPAKPRSRRARKPKKRERGS